MSREVFTKNFGDEVCLKICELLWGLNPSILPSSTWIKGAEPLKLTKSEDAKIQRRKTLINLLTSSKHLNDAISLDDAKIERKEEPKDFQEV